jgi:tripartite-type tricarboxylate transporter receptor subunit TctC
MLKLLAAGTIVLSTALIAGAPAVAQSWPSERQIRVVVPFPAGGAADAVARIVTEFAGRSLKQSFVVENVGGAGGNIGAANVAKSAPDGYTVLITGDPVASSPHISKVTYDVAKDLRPVIQLTRQPVVLAVHPSLGASTLAELIANAKSKGDLSYGTGGAGTSHHILGAWFAKQAGVTLAHVPYRGGGPAINDLLAGHIKIGSLGSTPIVPLHKAGTIKALAQSTKARAPSLPDVPTFAEAGFPDLVLDQWLAVFIAAGTPTDIVDRLNAEFNKALADPDVKTKLAASALEPVGGPPAALGQLVASDFEKYGRLVKELGIQMQN